MSNDKKILNENTVRRFMTLANLNPLSNTFITEQLDDEELGEPDLGGDELDLGGDELGLGDEEPGADWDVEQVRDLTVAITDAIEGVTGVETSVSGGEGGGEELPDLGGEEDEDLDALEEQEKDPLADLKGAFETGSLKDITSGTGEDLARKMTDATKGTPPADTKIKEAIQREALRRYQIHGTRLQEAHRRQLDQQTANNLYARCYNQVLQEYRVHQSRQLLINEVHKSVIAQLRMLTENNRQFTARDIEYIIRKTLNEVTKKSQKDSLVEAVMQKVATRLSRR